MKINLASSLKIVQKLDIQALILEKNKTVLVNKPCDLKKKPFQQMTVKD